MFVMVSFEINHSFLFIPFTLLLVEWSGNIERELLKCITVNIEKEKENLRLMIMDARELSIALARYSS